MNGRFAIADNDGHPVLAGIGDPVWINAWGRWYAGTIQGIGRSRLRVRFHTSNGLVERTKMVSPEHTGLVRARTTGHPPNVVPV